MTTDNDNTKQKQIYFRAYQDFSKLKTALKHLDEESSSHVQISILVKETQFYLDKERLNSKDTDAVKTYWKNLFGTTVNFGTFYSPQMGTVFIAGDLVSTFLHKINGKFLATLSSGAYGIFRGIGASETQTTQYLKLLSRGDYLLIIRGAKNKLQAFEDVLLQI